MFCSKCGKDVGIGARFCSACGTAQDPAFKIALTAAAATMPAFDGWLSRQVKRVAGAIGRAGQWVFAGILGVVLFLASRAMRLANWLRPAAVRFGTRLSRVVHRSGKLAATMIARVVTALATVAARVVRRLAVLGLRFVHYLPAAALRIEHKVKSLGPSLRRQWQEISREAGAGPALHCAQCSTQHSPDARFCSGCGAKLATAAAGTYALIPNGA